MTIDRQDLDRHIWSVSVSWLETTVRDGVKATHLYGYVRHADTEAEAEATRRWHMDDTSRWLPHAAHAPEVSSVSSRLISGTKKETP